jgi:hypothetical protein
MIPRIIAGRDASGVRDQVRAELKVGPDGGGNRIAASERKAGGNGGSTYDTSSILRRFPRMNAAFFKV